MWQFTTMPFGLCNAPATFERLMEKVLVDMPTERCLVYLDDLLVHGPCFDSAFGSLMEVMERIKRAGLKLHLGAASYGMRSPSWATRSVELAS